MVKVDNRNKEDIVAEIVERSKSYTPEWNMDASDPDIGAVLALAYADMLAGTLKKVNGTPVKNEIAFFNMVDASILPASPSEGYVSFTLSADDVGSTPIEKGAVMSSYSAEGDTMHFETCDDILVSPARIEKIFCADDSEDHIGEYENFAESRLGLFGLPPVNLQSHTMCISHPFAFDIRTEGQIGLRFFRKGGSPAGNTGVKLLADPGAADIEYYAGEDAGFVKFAEVRESDGDLVLVKDPKLPAVAADEEGTNIRVTVRKMAGFESFFFSRIEAMPQGKTIIPDHITDGNVEYDINDFYPFGERFQLFNEVYFGCAEALDKRGAEITMSFDMDIVEVPIENQLEDDGINYKWVASKKDFKEAKSYKIAITGVIWEYFNGGGWSRLFPDSTHADLFNIVQDVTACFKSITFKCPEDMTEVFVGAHSGFYIRARVLKAENLYKTKGWYLSPHIRNISFEYHYEDTGCRISDIVTMNNLEEQSFEQSAAASGENFTPFRCAGAEDRTVYFGFSAPPDNGPMRILWDIDEDPITTHPKLAWRYLTARGWKPMNIADETEGFTKVGLTVFLDNHGFEKTKLFGEELYWVSAADTEDLYRTKRCGLPVVNKIYFNSVRAVNVDSHNEEYFAMNIYTENAEFTLASPNVLDLTLYVNEFPGISEQDMAKLTEEGRVTAVAGSDGIDTELWVRWREVNSFAMEDKDSRCYVIDRSSGRITFGNGRKGRVPPLSDVGNIRVIYTTGGGERTNVTPGSITGLERSYGFVSGVMNPKRFYGGSDAETVYEAMRRSAVMLRTQGKAVTARDLESITFNASRNIRKLRCVSGRNASGARERGAVTLVVLKKEHSEFSRIRRDIKNYLSGRLPGTIVSRGSLYVTEPTFVRINVRAEIRTKELNGIFELKKSVERCLADYFASFSGTDGDNVCRLGMIPNEQQIRSALLRLKNVIYIRNLYITMYVSGAGGLKEVDSDTIGQYSYVLPENGEHDITVTVE
ncbi:MAG: baseplate J/gp47 family protein [Ruminiclostridium sp.]|nr:baseplate J/gp47 family protein [Ruminiclostridium sp.]